METCSVTPDIIEVISKHKQVKLGHETSRGPGSIDKGSKYSATLDLFQTLCFAYTGVTNHDASRDCLNLTHISVLHCTVYINIYNTYFQTKRNAIG